MSSWMKTLGEYCFFIPLSTSAVPYLDIGRKWLGVLSNTLTMSVPLAWGTGILVDFSTLSTVWLSRRYLGDLLQKIV